MQRAGLFVFLAISCVLQACGEIEGGIDPSDVNVVDGDEDAARRCRRYGGCTPPPAPTCAGGCSCPASNAWVSTALAAGQSGTFEVSFDATPGLGAADDLVVGLSSGPASAYDGLAAIVLFGGSGTIEAMNGGTGYQHDNTVSYVAGTTYHFIIDVDVGSHVADYYVTPAGGTKVALGSHYPFRSSQAGVGQLDTINAIDSASGASTLCNVTTSAWSPAPAPPAPPPVGSPSTLTHGKDLTLAMVGPSAIGITSFTTGAGTGISDASSAAYVRQINQSANYECGVSISGPHLLIEGANISGGLDIYATQPVVIRGSKISSTGWWGIFSRPGSGSTYLLYSEVGGIAANEGADFGIMSDNDGNTYCRNHVWASGDGFSLGGKNHRILENVVDQFYMFDGAHNDGLQAPGNNNGMVIARNKIILASGETGTINLGTWGGGVAQYVTIDANYLAGGGYTFYGGGDGQHDIAVTNNIFGTDVWPGCGYWGAVAYWSSGPGNVWTNNKKSDGTSINP